MRRTLVLAALIAAPLAVSAPAQADPPHAGCGLGFELEPYPPALAFLFAGADNNGDGLLCVKGTPAGDRLHDNTSAASSGLPG